MSQWAEIRHAHFVDGVPKKQIARNFRVNIKTVRRALEADQWPHKRNSPKRGRLLDPHRDRILSWLRQDPRITAKRIRRLLKPHLKALPAQRTVREFVAELRPLVKSPEVFIHRTHLPGFTAEFDFGESSALIAGKQQKVKFLVATLPASNVYFAKAYPVERLECLLDGIAGAFSFFGGLTKRIVLDNTSLAVRAVLKGPDRLENELFQSFRGQFPIQADFCAPGKGHEKGSVERGVDYVRGLMFRPRPEVDSYEALNELLVKALVEDLSERRLATGQSVEKAFEEEKESLRPLPEHMPETCRHLPVVADKYAHIRVDKAYYSVPQEYCRQALLAKLYHDRLEIVKGTKIVASHKRSFVAGDHILQAQHILKALERKHRAALEATAIQQWDLPNCFYQLLDLLQREVRKARQEWIRVLRLTEKHSLEDVASAVEMAIEQDSPRYSTVKSLLRVVFEQERTVIPVRLMDSKLSTLTVERTDLKGYDELGEVSNG